MVTCPEICGSFCDRGFIYVATSRGILRALIKKVCNLPRSIWPSNVMAGADVARQNDKVLDLDIEEKCKKTMPRFVKVMMPRV